jgi:beta-lactam-binding protein with PASTA domain
MLRKSLSAFGKLCVVLLLSIAFTVGLGGVLFLALRSPEVKVPEIVGRDYFDGEKELAQYGLKIRRRTDRFSEEKPNTILEQSPLSGENIKAGQTIAVVIARAQAESGEKPAEVKKETVDQNKNKADDQSDVDKARQKRKAANANKNADRNKNTNANNSNSNLNINENANASNSNSSNRNNSNARGNSSNGNNSNNRSTTNSNDRNAPTLVIRNGNTNNRGNAASNRNSTSNNSNRRNQ